MSSALSAGDLELGRRLLARGWVDATHLRRAAAEAVQLAARGQASSLGQLLVTRGWVAPARVQEALGVPPGSAVCSGCGAQGVSPQPQRPPCPRCGAALSWLLWFPPAPARSPSGRQPPPASDSGRRPPAPAPGQTLAGRPTLIEDPTHSLDGMQTAAGAALSGPTPVDRGTLAGARTHADATQGGRLPGAAPPAPTGDLITRSADLRDEIARAAADPARRCGRYLLLVELGRGAFGAVFRAWDPQHEREVALKRLDRVEEQARLRFAREIKAMARLRHPHLVPLLDSGEHEERPFLVMELARGEPLSTLVKGRRRPPVDEAARLIRDVARGVQHAHEHGVLHRDLKPDNVILTAEGEVRVVDFGLASLERDGSRLTRSDAVMGTPAYMPPEQAGGDGPADARSDVYSLGATLYELLCGRPPFQGRTTPELIYALHTREAPAPSQRNRWVPADLDTICLRCLEKEPGRRYPSAEALADDLERYLEDEPIAARPPGPGERARKWIRRNRALSVLGAASCLLLLGGAAAALRYAAHEREQARRAEREVIVARARAEALKRMPTPAAWQAGLEELAGEARGTELERRAASGLKALLAVQRWRTVAPGDAEAAQALRSTALALGRLTQLSGQWHLAAWAYAAARGSGDDGAVEEALAELETARTAQARRRAAELNAVLDEAEDGELAARPGGFDGAVFAMVRYPEEQTVRLLAARLQALAQALGEVEAELLRGAVEPNAEERHLGEARIAGLDVALKQRLREPTGQLPPAIAAARRRLEERERRRREAAFATRPEGSLGRPATRIIADRQGSALGARLDVARVAARTLARLGFSHPAGVEALGAYLRAEHDPQRALGVALALCRLGDSAAREQVMEARLRFGIGSPFAIQVDRLLAGTGDAEADGARAKTLIEVLQRAFVRGDLETAASTIEDILRHDPEHVGALAGRGQLRVRRGDYAGALADLRRCIEIAPTDPAGHSNLAILQHNLGTYDEALVHVERALELDPRRAEDESLRATVLRRLGRFAEALQAADRALALDPEPASAWHTRAEIHLERGAPAAALADAEQALRRDPDSVPLLRAQSKALEQLGRLDEALSAAERAVALAPENAEAHLRRARVRSLRGDLPGALADLEQAVQAQPGNALAWGNLGQTLAEVGRSREALQAFRQALELEPAQIETYANRAMLWVRLGRSAEAEADMQRALDLRPDSLRLWLNRAQMRLMAGRYQDALADADEAVRRAPEHAFAWSVRASIHRQRGAPARAVQDYERALKLDPKSAHTWESYSLAYLDLGDIPGALAACERALALDPQSDTAFNNRGLAHFKQGNWKAALADYDRSLALDAREALTWTNRAACYLNMERFAESERDADEAIALNSHHALAYLIRAQARSARDAYEGVVSDLERYLELVPGDRKVARQLAAYKAAWAQEQGGR